MGCLVWLLLVLMFGIDPIMAALFVVLLILIAN